MRVLGIETSCDETAVGIVELSEGGTCTLLKNEVASSMDLHVQYGGIVPEVAARSHIEYMTPILEAATADVPWDGIDAVAVTYGAGLGGCLLIGVSTAKTLAYLKNKPLYACNHVEGHVYANFITQTTLSNYALPLSAPSFPLLGVIVSGNHSQLVMFYDHFNYKLLGKTRDDAIGEAFDKVARMTGLPYPGGPSIARKAFEGDAHAFTFPKARLDEKYSFSFSGLKTAVLRCAQEQCGKDFTFPSTLLPESLTERQKADIVASFQRVALETIVDKVEAAYKEYSPASVVIAGGVAASTELRKQLSDRLPVGIAYTDPKLCTDNGAMIATLGAYKHYYGQAKADPFTLDIQPNLVM